MDGAIILENLVVLLVLALIFLNAWSLLSKRRQRRFLEAVLKELSRADPEKSFLEVRKEHRLDQRQADIIALDAYRLVLKAVFADRHIDALEEERLAAIRTYLGIAPERLGKVESAEVRNLYYHFLDYFFSDDIIENHEIAQLRLLKENLGRAFPAASLEVDRQKQTMVLNQTLQKVKEDGIVTQAERREVENLMQVLGVPDEVKRWVREDLDKYPTGETNHHRN